jgi:hypothetical protein
LFRLIFNGGSHDEMRVPAREGYLFDPDRYLFLEGRRERSDAPAIPRVSDGVVFRILTQLLLLDGERLSYRWLAVEQIGSVYEAIMGFELHVAADRSIGIKPAKRNGAPATINLQDLLSLPGEKRLKWLADNTDQKLTGQAADVLKAASTVEDLLAALDQRIAKKVTPNVVPKGAMIFQPSNERRRSGSHYTPSSLTGPIVEAALRPVLKQLGDNPTPDQILQLKVCDPAMGSGAFLVEACRQLGDALVKAWHFHNQLPVIPRDEDEVLHARRRIAQRCLYGVDKNPLAADLAKLSLWLATLAKDHPFTFLDHALRPGDSLVGFSRRQIAQFHWETSPTAGSVLGQEQLDKAIERVTRYRQEILEMPEDNTYSILLKQQKLNLADQALHVVRNAGDLLAAAFFFGHSAKGREVLRKTHLGYFAAASRGSLPDIQQETEIIARLRGGRLPVTPFHWEVELPEVFKVDIKGNPTGGFDVIVGNPPFAGKNTLINSHADGYVDWLQEIHAESHGNSDLVAHFFRRAFSLLRSGGCFGLIATNTIAQGDTRNTGLRWICTHGGTIYRARKRCKWPGQAAVIVSTVHVCRGAMSAPFDLDNRTASQITAYLFHVGDHSDPRALRQNAKLAFKGCEIGSLGYLLSKEQPEFSKFSSLKDPRDATSQVLKPYVGGKDLNEGGTSRFVLDVDGLTEAELNSLPGVRNYLEERVRVDFLSRGEVHEDTVEWWHFRRPSRGLREAIGHLPRLLVVSRVSDTGAFTFISGDSVSNSDIICFRFSTCTPFAVLQSRVHELWARFFASSMKDDLRYTPSDCFETFPFPLDYACNQEIESTGRQCYEIRAELMQRSNLGFTATYNRFHDPEEESPDIRRLRELHAAMDRAVLNAYGWTDIHPKCEFLLDYVEEEDEEENGPRHRKKPWRYRWPDESRDEVLARLLELNRQRALEEGQVVMPSIAATPPAATNPGNNRREKKAASNAAQIPAAGLFAKSKGES